MKPITMDQEEEVHKITTIIKIHKSDDEYGIVIPAGTEGNDIEFGLANAIMLLVDSQKEKNENCDLTEERFLNKLERIIQCIRQGA